MSFNDNIEKDIKNLERQSIGAFKSKYKFLKYDYSVLKDLLREHTDKSCDFFQKKYNYSNVAILCNYIELYIDELKELSQYIIDYYKSINFYYYGLDSYKVLSQVDVEKIIQEFLNYFNKESLDIFYELMDNDRIIFHQEKNILGITYGSTLLNSFYIGVSPNISSINFIETIIHEITHVYTFRFANNYNSNALESLYLGLFGEVATLYSELSFYNYLISNNIFVDEMLYHRNTDDYVALSYYKTMRYMAEAMTNGNDKMKILSNGIDYHIVGEFDYNPTPDTPFFKYSDSIKNGNLGDFTYGVSYIKAYEMLEREINGICTPKENIDNFIISLQDEASLLSFLEEPFSFPFYENELLKRNNALLKKYPLPGYKIL